MCYYVWFWQELLDLRVSREFLLASGFQSLTFFPFIFFRGLKKPGFILAKPGVQCAPQSSQNSTMSVHQVISCKLSVCGTNTIIFSYLVVEGDDLGLNDDVFVDVILNPLVANWSPGLIGRLRQSTYKLPGNFKFEQRQS